MSLEDYKIIRVKEAAELLGVSVPTIYRRCEDEDFPPRVRIGRAVGFKKKDVIEYIEQSTENKDLEDT